MKLAFAIASNPALSKQLRSDILKYKSRLYSNYSVITEWENMLQYIHSRPHDQYSPTPAATAGGASYCEQHRSEYDIKAQYDHDEYALALDILSRYRDASSDISSSRMELMHSLLYPTYDAPALSLFSRLENHETKWQELRLLWEKDGKTDVIYEINFENVIDGKTLSIKV